jgi:glyoxylase-like metal-dependent hydrolase (beta-lactamase superfamily II)
MKYFIIEGNLVKLDGGSMFGNAPKSLWEKWAKPDDQNRITLASRCLLVQTDSGKNILFEAGCGTCYDAKFRERFGIDSSHATINNLAAIGIKPADIDIIVMSHLHFDHAGGLLTAYEEGPLSLAFPNARYFISQTHWERAKKPHMRDQASFIPVLMQLLEQTNHVTMIDNKQSKIANLGIEHALHFSEGHTIGLMLMQLEMESGPLLYAADLIPGMPWMHAAISMGYDRYPEQLINEKKAMLEELHKREGKVFFTHDPVVSCALIKRDEKGKFSGEPTILQS